MIKQGGAKSWIKQHLCKVHGSSFEMFRSFSPISFESFKTIAINNQCLTII